jgi:hypothetical protein
LKSINPRNIDKQKPMLLLVTSSPTETIHLMEHVDFYNSKPYETMLSIVSHPLIKQKYQVVVRWHPAKINLGQKDKVEQEVKEVDLVFEA